MSEQKGWIGVDLDGTLAFYDGWKDGTIGAPIGPMVDRVRHWLRQDIEVRIFTARVGHIGDCGPRCAECERIIREARAIGAWCEEHIGQPLIVTNAKDFAMVQLWDDRCTQVEPNTGRTAEEIQDALDRAALHGEHCATCTCGSGAPH